MKKVLVSLVMSICIFTAANAQYKKDGTPDMRYKANKETYGNTYQAPTYSSPSPVYPTTTPKVERNYDQGGQIRLQNGYQKSNGTYVQPHIKTSPDNNTWNNKSNW